jgi:SAM-dependent methyltransferase
MTHGAERGMGGVQAAEELTGSYVRWRSSRLGRITDIIERQLLARLLGDVDGKKLLDVGCGDGALAFELARQGATVTAPDADPSMIAAGYLRTKSEATRVQFVEGDAERLPFDDATFDVVVAVTVLCFVQDAEHVVKEIVRVLKPEGRLVVAIHGGVHYPPCGMAARLLAPVDLRFGQETTVAAAFLAMSCGQEGRLATRTFTPPGIRPGEPHE